MAHFTDIRKKVLKEITAEEKPLTVNDIKNSMKDISPSTIYRALDFLEKEGYIFKISFDEDCFFYSSKDKRHFIYCEDCKAIKCVDICPSTASGMNEIEEEYGFKIKEHTLLIKGLCRQCLSKK